MAENRLNFSGVSMLPTLKPGDLLKLVRCKKREIHVGDVVAFQSPISQGLIVHRVVAFDYTGLRTKGDNNDRIDDWVLSPHNIFGRIVSAHRGGQTITILGGFRGRQYVRTIHTVRCLNKALMSALLSPLYHWLAKTGIFKKMFLCLLNTRIYCFKCGDQLELQILLGRRIIGRLFPGQKQWYIKRPFRLIVDEKSLPNNTFVYHVSSQHSLS